MLKAEAMKKPVGSSWTQESWHHVLSPSSVTWYDAGLAIKLLLIKSSEHGMESSNPHNQENVNQKNLSIVSDTPSLAPHWKATSGVCLQMEA